MRISVQNNLSNGFVKFLMNCIIKSIEKLNRITNAFCFDRSMSSRKIFNFSIHFFFWFVVCFEFERGGASLCTSAKICFPCILIQSECINWSIIFAEIGSIN